MVAEPIPQQAAITRMLPIMPRVIAHRGARTSAPENTIPAIREAKKLGSSWIEIDVMLSADGTVFLNHDRMLERCRSGAATLSPPRAPFGPFLYSPQGNEILYLGSPAMLGRTACRAPRDHSLIGCFWRGLTIPFDGPLLCAASPPVAPPSEASILPEKIEA